VKTYLNNLPLEDDPEVFGLHPNANITFEMKTCREFMDTILLIQPRISGGKAVKSTEEIV
jgi:dynein heavy chain